jgi:nicotinamide mononucleotide transporter
LFRNIFKLSFTFASHSGVPSQAEIIPIEKNPAKRKFFHTPDPGNAGVGKNNFTMTIDQWTSLLFQQIAQTNFIQWTAVVFAVTEVILAQRNNIYLYPAGIIATSISIFILFQAGLYAESVLNLYYFVMSIYGWWYWVRKKDRPEIRITYCNTRDWIIVISIVTTSFTLLALTLKNFTPSTVPYMDAWVAATAWAGMWLLARRKIENWILLNISNLFAIPLLFYKGLPLYALLTIFLFIVAIFGFIKWSRITRRSPVFAIN